MLETAQAGQIEQSRSEIVVRSRDPDFSYDLFISYAVASEPGILTESYTNIEFDAILKRQVEERGNIILPGLLRGTSQKDLKSFSPVLSTLRNVDAERLGWDKCPFGNSSSGEATRVGCDDATQNTGWNDRPKCS